MNGYDNCDGPERVFELESPAFSGQTCLWSGECMKHNRYHVAIGLHPKSYWRIHANTDSVIIIEE